MIQREPRLPAQMPIILAARGLGRHFVIENVSPHGAAVAGEKQLRVGERVTLNFAQRTMDATVRWAKEDRAGVRFKERLDEGTLQSVIGPDPGDTPQDTVH